LGKAQTPEFALCRFEINEGREGKGDLKLTLPVASG
jgi:hypothetical protein